MEVVIDEDDDEDKYELKTVSQSPNKEQSTLISSSLDLDVNSPVVQGQPKSSDPEQPLTSIPLGGDTTNDKDDNTAELQQQDLQYGQDEEKQQQERAAVVEWIQTNGTSPITRRAYQTTNRTTTIMSTKNTISNNTNINSETVVTDEMDWLYSNKALLQLIQEEIEEPSTKLQQHPSIVCSR